MPKKTDVLILIDLFHNKLAGLPHGHKVYCVQCDLEDKIVPMAVFTQKIEAQQWIEPRRIFRMGHYIVAYRVHRDPNSNKIFLRRRRRKAALNNG